ncbi:hypothetical protein J3R30DRAFT_3241686, partial [Lentinula aciculospora]
EEVKKALRLSGNNKAPGINGIRYEIWEILNARFRNAKAHHQDALNIIWILQVVYNDITTHGIVV